MNRPAFDVLDGAILVDKPPGPTSHDIVEIIRRHFDLQKVGHCGTLDPNASGLLVLMLGRATKLSEKFIGSDKQYTGDVKFGETTDSYDVDGQIIGSAPVPELTLDRLNALADGFLGDQMQVPPMVSAIKQQGVPLYKLARKGVEVERKPRLIHIYRFRFITCVSPTAQFEITCTKGTYVRSIAHEIGQKVGCGAHLASLRRTVAGHFNVADAIPLAEIRAYSLDDLKGRIIPFLKLVELADQ